VPCSRACEEGAGLDGDVDDDVVSPVRCPLGLRVGMAPSRPGVPPMSHGARIGLTRWPGRGRPDSRHAEAGTRRGAPAGCPSASAPYERDAEYDGATVKAARAGQHTAPIAENADAAEGGQQRSDAAHRAGSGCYGAGAERARAAGLAGNGGGPKDVPLRGRGQTPAPTARRSPARSSPSRPPPPGPARAHLLRCVGACSAGPAAAGRRPPGRRPARHRRHLPGGAGGAGITPRC
jgi:hypothetical protein